MGKTHLVVPDQHAAPGFHNDRADWLGQLIKDIKPDVLINIGDAADMSSLSSYDKGKAQFHGRNYEKDINAHLDLPRAYDVAHETKQKEAAVSRLFGGEPRVQNQKSN
jgi:hypothetical protein